jgi:hypothetical protein
MFTLDIGIEKVPEEAFPICDEIEKELGKSRDSSGYGWSVRDMQFEFETETEALAAEEKVKEIFAKHNIVIAESTNSYFSVYNNEENEEE